MKNKLTIALASGNNHKIAELNKLLSEFGDSLQICGAETFGGMPDVDENADTFEGNALIKARALMEQSGQSSWILADDSGLEVNALNGAPGIYSARYAGVGSSDSDNVQKLLDELQQIPEAQRKARFVCVLVLLAQSGDYHTFRGECQGRILYHATGQKTGS